LVEAATVQPLGPRVCGRVEGDLSVFLSTQDMTCGCPSKATNKVII